MPIRLPETSPESTPSNASARTRRAVAVSTLLTTLALSLAAMPASAEPGATAPFYASGVTSGSAVRLVGESADRATATFGLTGAPSGTTSTGYSLDVFGVAPTTNTTYTEQLWPTGVADPTNAGAVEWILRNSHPTVSAATLGTAVGTTPTLTQAKAIAATQAAIWHFTDGRHLDTFRLPDIATLTSPATPADGSPADLIDASNTSTGWRSTASGATEFVATLQASLVPSRIAITSLEGGSAANAPRRVELARLNPTTRAWVTQGSWTLSGTGTSNGNEFTGGTSQTKLWSGNWASSGYGAGDTYRLTITPKDTTQPLELAGIRFDAATEYRNDSQIVAAYTYLVDEAAGRAASTATQPVVTLSGRVSSAVVAGEAAGPFTVDGSTTATLALSGSDAGVVRIVDAAGATLSGAVAPGTQFWLQDTRATPLDARVTITATATAQTSTSLITRTGVATAGGARATISGLRTQTLTADDALDVNWVIDRTSGGTFDDGQATKRTYEYRYPLEQSPTEATVIWADGSTSVTDLFGLRGTGTEAGESAAAYSIDAARNNLLQNRLDYVEQDWAEGRNTQAHDVEAQVAWILSNSYPAVDTSTLSTLLRAGDSSFGTANLRIWNAIAATQAAIWHFTDGRDLDTRRLGQPVSATADTTSVGSAGALLTADATTGWRADAAEASVAFTLPLSTKLTSYTVTTLAGGDAANTPQAWRLQRSVTGADGTWVDVSTSTVQLSPSEQFTGGAAAHYTRNLPDSVTYGSGNGYQHYRVVFTATAGGPPVEISSVRFGTAIPTINNPQIVALYEHLVGGADAEAPDFLTPAPSVAVTAPQQAIVAENQPVGPFTVEGSRARVSISADARSGVAVVDVDGAPLGNEFDAGSSFYLSPGDLSADERYDGADVSVTIEAVGTSAARLAARALNTTQGTQETLTILGTSVTVPEQTQTVSWQITAPLTASLTTSASSVVAGNDVGFVGDGFRPGERVDVQFADGATVNVTADVAGGIAGTLSVPWDAASGTAHVVANGAESGRVARTTQDVTATVAEIGLSTDLGKAGEIVSIVGAGFKPGEPVTIELHSEPIALGKSTALADGTLATTFTVPADATAEEHDVVVAGDESSRVATAAFTVDAPSSTDPGPGTSAPASVEPGSPAEPTTPVQSDPAPSDPAPSDPVSSGPVPSNPVSSDPVPSDPVSERPVPSDPVSERPVSERPVSERPVSERPVSERPVPSDPASSDPVPSGSVPERPVPPGPAASDPPSGSSAPSVPTQEASAAVSAGPSETLGIATPANSEERAAGLPSTGPDDLGWLSTLTLSTILLGVVLLAVRRRGTQPE